MYIICSISEPACAVNRDVAKKPHPEVLKPYLPEIKDFAKFNHTEVLDKVLR
jgi:hypothetical protein